MARVMRRELKKRGIEKLKVVYSEEVPVCQAETGVQENKETYGSEGKLQEYADRDAGRRSIPGSVAFVPSVAGLLIAGEVIKDLCG